ncbi:hypothetical protein IFM89_038808 [Coptis chinensis]|uniref:SWIM-type domain-containing protein n=1 Tax=Coptis chinensis TaxID=261450 RepID=A0A835LP01_9MAGN|nr:hypothetical protein IFM89_038808 [Coptis chinensis]
MESVYCAKVDVARSFKIDGFPCVHAVASIISSRGSIYSFIDPTFTVSSFSQSYSHSIHPIANIEMPMEILEDCDIMPPYVRRGPRSFQLLVSSHSNWYAISALKKSTPCFFNFEGKTSNFLSGINFSIGFSIARHLLIATRTLVFCINNDLVMLSKKYRFRSLTMLIAVLFNHTIGLALLINLSFLLFFVWAEL